MIHTSPTLPSLPTHYRQHTSFLRGCSGGSGNEEERLIKLVDKETEHPSLYPFYPSILRQKPNGKEDEDERRSSLVGAYDRFTPAAETSSIRSSPYSTHSDDSSMTTTASMSLASRADTAAEGGASVKRKNSDDRLARLSPSAAAAAKGTREMANTNADGQGASPRRPPAHEGDASFGASNKLPGIAHLDRHMHTPWNAPRSDVRGGGSGGSEDEYYHSRYSPSALRERYDPDASRSGNGFRRPSYAADRFGGPMHSSADRLPSYRSMYKRSDSPAGYRDVDRADGADERMYAAADEKSNAAQDAASRSEGRSTTWPSSPAFRRDDGEGGAGYAAGPGPHASIGHADYHHRDGERSSLPPLHHPPPRGTPSMMAARDEGMYRARSPVGRTSYEGAPPRGLGLATDGGLHHPDGYGSYNGGRPAFGGALPRSSSSSLRSLSMPYGYDQQHGGGPGPHRSGYVDSHHHYDENSSNIVSSRHSSISGGGAMHAAHVSSPRHHPYASVAAHPGSVGSTHGMPAVSSSAANSSASVGGGYGAGDLQQQVGGGHSPGGSVPRRRGKLPKPVTDLLKTWLLDHAAHPYPTEDEKRRLCAATGLSISQVSNWFINARRRILVPQGSGHFGVAPSSAAALNDVGGGADLDHRRSPPNASMLHHPPPHHPDAPPTGASGSAAYHHGPSHHQHASSSHHYQHHPSSHHYDSAHHPYQAHHSYASHPSAPFSTGGPGRPSGLPLGPPPLPSSHHHGQARLMDHGTYRGERGSNSDGRYALERYPRSADHSPILSRRRDSP